MSEADLPSPVEEWPGPMVIGAAIRRAVREAVLMHARAGNPVSTLRDGQVVWLQPDEILRLLGADEPR